MEYSICDTNENNNDSEDSLNKMLPRICHLFRLKYVILGLIVIFVLDFFGVFTHFFEEDFHTTFDYPLNDPYVLRYAKQVRNGKEPDLKPINTYNYTLLSDCRYKCRQPDDDEMLIVPRLVFIIKSAMENFNRRSAIRQSWGFEKRFSDVIIRTVFMLGVSENKNEHQINIQKSIDKEREQFNDIVQGDFIDSYYNNTIKTMMGLRWAIENCPRSRFFMFVDDDFYVSTKNVLRFLRNPVNYPEYLDDADETLRKLARRLSQSDLISKNQSFTQPDENEVKQIKDLIEKHSIHTIDGKNHLNEINKYLTQIKSINDSHKNQNNEHEKYVGARQLLDTELPYDVKLFSGFVFTSYPHRHKSSKWYVPLSEYKWHMWPSYVTAGSFILSREALIEMYYMSMYTKHFR